MADFLLGVCLQVIDQEVCYRYDMYESCMEILQDRARLYRKVYHHRQARAALHAPTTMQLFGSLPSAGLSKKYEMQLTM